MRRVGHFLLYANECHTGEPDSKFTLFSYLSLILTCFINSLKSLKLAAHRKWTFTAFACNTQMHLYGLFGASKPLTTFSCSLWASACFVSKFKSFFTFGQSEWGWTKDLNLDLSLNQLLTTSWGIWSGTSDSMKWGKTCRKWKLNSIKRQTEMSRLLCTISASTKRFKRDTLMTRNRWRTILRSTTNLKSRIQFISTG